MSKQNSAGSTEQVEETKETSCWTKPQKSTNQVMVFIDIECSIPNQFVSEVYALAGYFDYCHRWTPLSEFHRLCTVPPVHCPKATTVYKEITGLSYHTLNSNGVPFKQMLQELSVWLSCFDGMPIYARDPRQEQRMLGSILKSTTIMEVCDLLISPFNTLFMSRHSKQRIAACVYSGCEHHDPVKHGHPHCAKKDVWDMTYWVSCYGIQHC